MTDFELLCNEYRENKRLIEELNALNDGLKSKIIELMAGRDTVVCGSAKASNKLVNSTRLDTNAIKKEYPDIYARYSAINTYNRFTVV